MKIVLFTHSLISDWNHGNAHFTRGIASDLVARGHEVRVFEPRGGWSLANLIAEHGESVTEGFHERYPSLRSEFYDPATLDLDEAFDGAALVIVHEWSDPLLVRRAALHRRQCGPRYRLLFHDTHHRSVTDPESFDALPLADFDGVLAYGRTVRDQYLARGWADHVWVWHEAADTRVFYPRTAPSQLSGDLVWIGNWGDDERSEELREFLLAPVSALGLGAKIYGVRYPPHALAVLAERRIKYGGWLANYHVPEAFAKFRVTVHVPRRAYVTSLPGVPTIRPFEALACGIPLVSAPWEDVEGLFRAGTDYLVARNGREMRRHLATLMLDRDLRDELARNGRATILARHTCAHRVDELMGVLAELNGMAAEPAPSRGWTSPRLPSVPGPALPPPLYRP